MAEGASALQQGDVVAFVSAAADKSCAIVHPASKVETLLSAHGKGWGIYASLRSAPSVAEAATFKGIGLRADARKTTLRFGPHAGQTIEVPLVRGEFMTLEAAASAGLALVRLLANDPSSWVWIAPREYDDRGKPPAPPTVWPPQQPDAGR